MGSFSLVHWMILLVVVVLIFGAGRLPHAMGDLAKGIKAFKAGMRDEEKDAAASVAPSTIAQTPAQPVPGAAETVVGGERKVG